MQNAGVLKKELLEANLRLELLENGSPSTDQRMQMHNLIPVVAALCCTGTLHLSSIKLLAIRQPFFHSYHDQPHSIHFYLMSPTSTIRDQATLNAAIDNFRPSPREVIGGIAPHVFEDRRGQQQYHLRRRRTISSPGRRKTPTRRSSPLSYSVSVREGWTQHVGVVGTLDMDVLAVTLHHHQPITTEGREGRRWSNFQIFRYVIRLSFMSIANTHIRTFASKIGPKSVAYLLLVFDVD